VHFFYCDAGNPLSSDQIEDPYRRGIIAVHDAEIAAELDWLRSELNLGPEPGAAEGLYLECPVYANWGCNTYWGAHCYANFNLTLVDDGEIIIGDHVMLGPNVTLVTTGHPVRPDLRLKAAQFSLPIHIGENVWIGAGVTVLPGVTIGDNAVIGAGSLVTKDIPADCVAYGSPCKVVRHINEHDDVYYWHDRRLADRFAAGGAEPDATV
jgi:galactoside O-acetyltransferase